MADIFISYARNGRPAVEPIAHGLLKAGFDVWWDEKLPVHRSYTDVIEETLHAAKAVIVVWSPEAAQSEWVRAEAEVGRTQRKLVQILIDDAALPIPFNQTQYADLRRWTGDPDDREWRKVLGSLEALLSGQPQPTAVSPRRLGTRLKAATSGRLPAGPMSAVAVGLAVVVAIAAVLRAPHTPHAAADVPQPSFACSAAASDSEKFICTDAVVARAELAMATAYRAARNRAPDRPRLVASQRDFLQRLTNTPQTREAYIALFKARTDTLNGLAVGATGPARSPDPSGFLFPDSDRRILTEGDLQGLSLTDLRLAHDEILARAGRIFADPDVQRRFADRPWYHPISRTAEPSAEIARLNLAFLEHAEQRRAPRHTEGAGDTP